MRPKPLCSLLLVFLLLAACRRSTEPTQETPIAVATTPMLADLVSSVAGGTLQTIALVPIGADPHLYQPTPGDVRRIGTADVLVRNGLHLEGFIDDLAGNAPEGHVAITASDAVEAQTDDGGVPDPHFWLDAERWRLAGVHVAARLTEMFGDDPAAQQRVREGLAAFEAEATRMHTWIGQCIATIPEPQRVLVTSHDAFGYYGATYGLRVVAIQGMSTAAEASHRDVARVVDVVREAAVPAIFVETSVQPALLEQVARETGVTLAGPLYSDSLGDAGSGAETWAGMLRVNTEQIASALGGRCPPLEAP